VGAVTGDVREALTGADAVFFDGTFWSPDELPAQGLGTKRAEDMAHVPVGGAAGSLAQLAGVRAGRRIYIHLNNTNPVLRDDSRERETVVAAGWEVAWDGMEVRL
jgi:pyrroloquinoline quinone biosynthesis protein B